MSTLVPLAVWGAMQPGDLQSIRKAKETLNPPFTVTVVPAVPGNPSRVLALRQTPPFLVDHAPLAHPENEASMLAALRWVLDDTVEDDRAVLVVDMLRGIFGPGVREIFPSALEELVDDETYAPYKEVRRHDPND